MKKTIGVIVTILLLLTAMLLPVGIGCTKASSSIDGEVIIEGETWTRTEVGITSPDGDFWSYVEICEYLEFAFRGPRETLVDTDIHLLEYTLKMLGNQKIDKAWTEYKKNTNLKTWYKFYTTIHNELENYRK